MDSSVAAALLGSWRDVSGTGRAGVGEGVTHEQSGQDGLDEGIVGRERFEDLGVHG
jgi:hypothetical protein